MYFKNIAKIQIQDLTHPSYQVYAHQNKGKKELLTQHTQLVIKYFEKIVATRGLEKIFHSVEALFFTEEEDQILFREMLYHTMVFHDVGKINPNFQKIKMDHDTGVKTRNIQNTKHSLLSAILYSNHFMLKIGSMKKEKQRELLDFLFLNAYTISRHHKGNDSMDHFFCKFDRDGEGEGLLQRERILYEGIWREKVIINEQIIKSIRKERIMPLISSQSKEQLLSKYSYQRLLLSLLFASDYYATMEFMDGIENKHFGSLDDIEHLYQAYAQGDVYKSIRTYEKTQYGKNQDFTQIQDINLMRTELFLEAEEELLKNIDKKIFYLEAPTGSGKSNTAMNLSFQLLKNQKELNKIIYIYPFNTLVEQNKAMIENLFLGDKEILKKIAVVNSITAIKMDQEEAFESETEDMQIQYYKKALIDKQFLNYPMILSTHVTLFRYLFGIKKGDIFPLHQLANSVIVLDEIQSYKNEIWSEIITFLNAYADILNIKIIIMSATLPNLSEIALMETDLVHLIKKREKYYQSPIFKNRVSADYSLLDASSAMEEIYEHVKVQSNNQKKLLIEFIAKKDAELFFERLCEDTEIQSEKLLFTGDDSLSQRKSIIDMAKLKTDVILVATQVIEAGVDIDMDIGYKNISPLDNEEQFMGRINRSCRKKESVVYFFKITEMSKIYKRDIRNNRDLSLEEKPVRILLENKQFKEYYAMVFERLIQIKKQQTEENIEDFFALQVGKQNYDKVEKRMELIESVDEISIFLNREIEMDGQISSGAHVWEDYRDLLQNKAMDYAEKQVKLSRVTALLNNWVYKIRWNIGYQINFCWNDKIGDLYYILDGEQYIKNGKVDRAKIIEGGGEIL